MSHRCHEHVYGAVILSVAGKPHFVAFTFVKALRVASRHVQRVGGFCPCPHVGGKGNVDRGTFQNSKSMCMTPEFRTSAYAAARALDGVPHSCVGNCFRERGGGGYKCGLFCRFAVCSLQALSSKQNGPEYLQCINNLVLVFASQPHLYR